MKHGTIKYSLCAGVGCVFPALHGINAHFFLVKVELLEVNFGFIFETNCDVPNIDIVARGIIWNLCKCLVCCCIPLREYPLHRQPINLRIKGEYNEKRCLIALEAKLQQYFVCFFLVRSTTMRNITEQNNRQRPEMNEYARCWCWGDADVMPCWSLACALSPRVHIVALQFHTVWPLPFCIIV